MDLISPFKPFPMIGSALLVMQNSTQNITLCFGFHFSLELWYFASSSFTCYRYFLVPYNFLLFVFQRVFYETALFPCPLESPLFAVFLTRLSSPFRLPKRLISVLSL